MLPFKSQYILSLLVFVTGYTDNFITNLEQYSVCVCVYIYNIHIYKLGTIWIYIYLKLTWLSIRKESIILA
jgi:hypothetical protein